MDVKKGVKEDNISEKYIKWFSEISKDDVSIVGGKGANLGEMFRAKLPVPPGFVITAHAFDVYLQKAGLKEQIKSIISETDIENTNELNENAEKIRGLITSAEVPEDMKKEIVESYEILGTEEDFKYDSTVNKTVLSILKNSQEPAFVAVRSSATAEDLADASFAGQQESFTNVKGDTELIQKVKQCFASLYTSRAIYYRQKKGFKHEETFLAVVVQKMVNSDKSGVMFTKDPLKKSEDIVIEAVFGLGEGIVSGTILPDHYVVSRDLKLKERTISNKKIAITRDASGRQGIVKLSEEKSRSQVLVGSEIQELANLAIRIEEHYKKPQDIEFAIDTKKVYVVQSRPITTLERPDQEQNIKIDGELILSGLAASPGIASGKVKIVSEMKDLNKIKKGDIMVTEMTNPDMVVAMQRANAIITNEGGATSHAAIVSREMGIPCVVGTESATKLLKDDMIVTVDGANGKVYEGGVVGQTQKKEVLPIIPTKTKIKTLVDLPDFAERAAKTQCDSVGLLRLEGIIASSGKHPLYFLKQNNLEDYTEIIRQGIEKISFYFKSVWIRTSDIRSDEYRNIQGAPQDLELNPMLGFHGIRFSLKNLGIFEAELEAIKRVADKYPEKEFGIMFPQIITEEEIKKASEIIKEKYQRPNIKIGAMIETPAAVQIIRNICKYVKFISFGTNDLTQFTLAVDRGNEDVQYLYDETHPAVRAQIRRVISICKEYGVETSICGQAGSNKDMVRYLVINKIDSISVNADMANEISRYVRELELQNPNKHDNTNLKKEISSNIRTQEIGESDKINQIYKKEYVKELGSGEISISEKEKEISKKIDENIEDLEEQVKKIDSLDNLKEKIIEKQKEAGYNSDDFEEEPKINLD